MEKPFVPLHVHTQYSLLEGAIRIKMLPNALKKRGFHACAITDLGNMFGAIEFYETLKKQDITPIIGMEAYVADGGRHNRSYSRKGPNASKLVLLCQNKQGYHNLCKLASLGYVEGKYYQPRIDLALLEKHHHGLIALSSGEWGVVGRPLRLEGIEKAKKAALWFKQVFGERFYLEVQNQGSPWEKEGIPHFLNIAQSQQIPLVGTNECFYLEAHEGEAQQLLTLIGRQKTIHNGNVDPQTETNRHLRSALEMQEALAHFPPQALHNSAHIAQQCQLDLSNKIYHLPQCESPPGVSEDAHLRSEAARGLAQRLTLLSKRYQWPVQEQSGQGKAYEARLQFELGIITNMEYSGYFLIVADFIRWAKKNQVRVGPGRGSGAGSLVAYALGITDLDPIYHGLLFERFLNPERVSMPDFDIDFDVEGRDKVINYVREKYGHQRVCQISTFGSLGAKAAVRNVARVLGFDYQSADRIAKLIPNKLGITLADALSMEPELKKLADEGSENEQRLLRVAQLLEGLSSNLSTHAAGVIILSQDVQDVMPVCTSSKLKGAVQSQYAMKWAEHQGAVKFDFLGLNNLTIIQRALNLINNPVNTENEGVTDANAQSSNPANQATQDTLDLDAIPLDDPKVYALLGRAESTGIFQLESQGMRRLLVDLQPTCFEDIVALLALYRPGPLDSGMTNDFIKRKNGQAKISHLHPDLAPVLSDTYGVMAYQEQVMEAARVLGGFSLGEADILRRAMGKKDSLEMAQQRQRFVEGCAKNNIAAEKAEHIFDQIDKFAGYGFNKSHSAAYALIAYQTAYLKAHYPVAFMAALLSSEMGNSDKMASCLADCNELGVKVSPPDVNGSEADFTVHQNQIRFGMSAIKNVGHHAARAILQARLNQTGQRFASLEAFLRSVDLRKVNKRSLETLIQCGSLDSLHRNRKSLRQGLEHLLYIGQQYQNAQVAGQETLLNLLGKEDEASADTLAIQLPTVEDYPLQERLRLEKEAIGVFVSGHPLDLYKSEVSQLTITSRSVREGEHPNGQTVVVAGIVTNLTLRLNRKSEKFAVLTIEDLHGSVEVVVFASMYQTCNTLLRKEEPLLVQGRINQREQGISIQAETITSLQVYRSQHATSLTMSPTKSLSPAVLRRLNGVLAEDAKSSASRCALVLRVKSQNGCELDVQMPSCIEPTSKVVENLLACLPHAQYTFTYDANSNVLGNLQQQKEPGLANARMPAAQRPLQSPQAPH